MTPRPGSKAAAVLAALKRRAGLTSMEAFSLGETTLPSTVYVLRRAGHHIVGKPQLGTSRYGRTCRFMRYRCTNTGNTSATPTPSKGNHK